MGRLLLFVAGLAFLLGAAVIFTGIESGDIDPSGGATDPVVGRSQVQRVFWLLLFGGVGFLAMAIRETLFPRRGNEAIRRKREKERARGVIRK